METDRPGQEVSKEHRRVITHLIDNEGWAYKKPKGNGYPRLYPPGPDQVIRVPKTGHAKGHAFDNWLAAIRRNGGHWPPAGNDNDDDDDDEEMSEHHGAVQCARRGPGPAGRAGCPRGRRSRR